MTGRASAIRPARWWYGVAALLVLALLAWLIGFSSVLGVRSVDVVGARTVSAAQVRTAAGIRPGTPLARLDLAAVSARLREVAPIRSVTVSRSYPATVTIRITERVAIGYRPAEPGGSGGAVLLVDRDDVAFRTVGSTPKHLPRLLVPPSGAAASAAALVTGSLPAAIVAKLASVSAPSEQSVTLSLRDGRSVLWGGTDRSADKARLLAVLLGQPGRYFDLSDPSAVTSRLDPGN